MFGFLVRREDAASKAVNSQNIGITAFVTAFNTAIIVFFVQVFLFVVLRNRLARIFKPRTYLVPERERTDPPPANLFVMLRRLVMYDDRKVINKCGLDAYFFLRYLKTLLVIFIPICCVVLPILIPINFIGGRSNQINASGNGTTNDTSSHNVGSNNSSSSLSVTPSGLDTLAWGNVSPKHTNRYAAHLVLAILVVIWVCTVFFFELRVYIKVRQDYLTSAEHRLRASATTVLVNSIPEKWLTVDALVGLFDVFPGGVRNIWLNRDMTKLLDKIEQRGRVHAMLESAETNMIKAVKKAQVKQRDAQEKRKRRQQSLKALSKKERAARNAEQDAEASRLANSGEGTNAGSQELTMDSALLSANHDVSDRVSFELETVPEEGWKQTGSFATHGVKKSLSRVGRGFRGAASKASNDVTSSLARSHGFMTSVDQASTTRETWSSKEQEQVTHLHSKSLDTARSHSRSPSDMSTTSHQMTVPGSNTVRQLASIDDMYVQGRTRFWQFWKPPTGAYTSPVPQGETLAETTDEKTQEDQRSGWQRFKESLPFVGSKKEKKKKKKKKKEKLEYPPAHEPDVKADDDEGAEWAKYIKAKDRPTHRLDPFGVHWLPGLPWFNKKVDTIYWCREELARLNLEIEEDQKHPEQFPLMKSAFIQFNHQVAAHMACQSVVHHIPRQMAPRMNEISPRDVVWANMALSWWQAWLRTGIVVLVVAAMILLWTVPVAWSAALGQLDKLLRSLGWLGPLEHNTGAMGALKGLSGVLPTVFLAVALLLVPMLLRLLAGFQGAKTGAQRTEFVQIYYFVFLFVQVFLVVSVASFIGKSVTELLVKLSQLSSASFVLDLLALNLPASANYFFSYMMLQGLSTGAATLLQVAPLFAWFILASLFDSTPRDKWLRNTRLKEVEWDSLFPVYTNFACIGLVYCIIAPLISIFVIITFSLLWVAQRYAMLYVCRFETDTGGVLYPRAINQTFTGLYFMELCMAGLFLIVQDEKQKRTCTTHGIVMIVVLALTVLYQVLLNKSFSPLFRYLPITFEDEAVLRDEAFQRAQDARFGGQREEEGARHDVSGTDGSEAKGRWRLGEHRRRHRRRDLEAQRAIGDALYGGVPDDIEDLTPDERDVLTRHAFQHYALRARRPTVWIPRDDVGVSDDEIRRTREYSDHIWISNEGTALDSRVGVVYGRNPPDWSEADIINL
ncbi:hypothetical protein CDD80_6494 [Ophiocordyceps camponoti-rufipedis]|uniref:CSC1/OSCA1-like 7TM region domain-containing protein n=1 Tax=Ophiocordyceps camponoti-rufipedis TaxID=2004952 RepID=A0A2C5ZG35_9HYPO|nr:hypothetical protein CDD80_6494 [Ophiocordyceps camponoti-rufipedis]